MQFRSSNLVVQASAHDTYRASQRKGKGFLTNPTIPLWARLLLAPMYIADIMILVALAITFGIFLIVPFVLFKRSR